MILTQALFATTNIIFQVKLRYDLSTIGLVAGSLATLVFALIAVNQNWGVFWINFGYVLAGLVTFFVNATFVKRLGVKISLSFDADVWKYLFVQALPLGLMFVFSQINFKADSILLSVLPLPQKFNLSNTDSVALYSLPYKIFEVSLVLPTFFMNSMYPVFVRHMSAGSKKLKQTFYKSMLVLFGGGLIVGLAGYVLAPIIIKLLGGSEFEASVSVLRILLGGVFLFYLTQPISWLIVTLKKQVYLPIVYFISAAFNLLLNTILIPKYSFYASAYLTWVSEILILILLAFFAVKAYKTFYAKA